MQAGAQIQDLTPQLAQDESNIYVLTAAHVADEDERLWVKINGLSLIGDVLAVQNPILSFPDSPFPINHEYVPLDVAIVAISRSQLKKTPPIRLESLPLTEKQEPHELLGLWTSVVSGLHGNTRTAGQIERSTEYNFELLPTSSREIRSNAVRPGDSGGPVIERGPNNETRVVGLISVGSPHGWQLCVSLSTNVRAEIVRQLQDAKPWAQVTDDPIWGGFATRNLDRLAQAMGTLKQALESTSPPSRPEQASQQYNNEILYARLNDFSAPFSPLLMAKMVSQHGFPAEEIIMTFENLIYLFTAYVEDGQANAQEVLERIERTFQELLRLPGNQHIFENALHHHSPKIQRIAA